MLQCQVPTWLGEFRYVKPKHTTTRVYANNQEKHFTCVCTCDGIQPGRVGPTSPTELTTSRIDALQARFSGPVKSAHGAPQLILRFAIGDRRNYCRIW